jgi:hypothetical protein
VLLIQDQTISLYHLELYQDLDQVLHLDKSKEKLFQKKFFLFCRYFTCEQFLTKTFFSLINCFAIAN